MSLMETIGLALPELDSLRPNTESRPEFRTRHVSPRVFLLVFHHALVERRTRLQRLALSRGPRSDLTEAMSGGEVGIGLFICNFRNCSFDPHLNVDGWPIEAESRLGVRQEVA